jgi:hypothetical protein
MCANNEINLQEQIRINFYRFALINSPSNIFFKTLKKLQKILIFKKFF